MLSAGTRAHLLVLNIVTTDTLFTALLGKTLKKAQDLWTPVAMTPHGWEQQGNEKRKKKGRHVYRKAGIRWTVYSDGDTRAMFIMYY